MTIRIPRWLMLLALFAAFCALIYGVAIPLIRLAIWCGPHGCDVSLFG